ncbi:MAG: aminotransferase class V-fold PLP-dependent enzyme [Planctomycetaceae bacterium]
MLSELMQRLNFQPIINAVGYATRVSGSCPHPDIIDAVREASSRFWEVDDLLTAASTLIRESTGAEAGIVTSGASAALALAAAACLAGNDPDIMDRLPDTTGCARDEIIYPISGPYDYDHPIRLAGAKLVTVDYRADDAIARIERAITPRTAAIGYVWLTLREMPDIGALVELAHRHGVPVIVDAACALPPATNLTSIIGRGADLVAYSGGKHLGGPQASGILCGREELIRSAWVQMVDMDVRAGTWSLQRWVDDGWISRSPRHGIGRSMKVSKESIVGLMAALARYAKRDHAAEYASWKATIAQIHAGVRDLKPLRVTALDTALNGQKIPLLQIETGEAPVGLRARDLVLALRQWRRKIVLAEDEQSPDRVFLYAQCLQPGDAEEIIAAIQHITHEHQERTTR